MTRKVCTCWVQDNYSSMYFQSWLLNPQMSTEGWLINYSMKGLPLFLLPCKYHPQNSGVWNCGASKGELAVVTHGSFTSHVNFPLGGLQCLLIVLFINFFLSSIQHFPLFSPCFCVGFWFWVWFVCCFKYISQSGLQRSHSSQTACLLLCVFFGDGVGQEKSHTWNSFISLF